MDLLEVDVVSENGYLCSSELILEFIEKNKNNYIYGKELLSDKVDKSLTEKESEVIYRPDKEECSIRAFNFRVADKKLLAQVQVLDTEEGREIDSKLNKYYCRFGLIFHAEGSVVSGVSIIKSIDVCSFCVIFSDIEYVGL